MQQQGVGERQRRALDPLAAAEHIGKPAVPLVKEGDRVIEGQRIAEVGREEFGANIHASINGVVTKVEKSYIEIDGMV